MAASSRHLVPLPFSLVLLDRCPQCFRIRYSPSRPFSTTLPSMAAPVVSQMPRDSMPRMPPRKSRKVEMKKVSASQVSDDVGLLPQTFIRPPNRDMPKLFSSKWKFRLNLEWFWLRTRAQNFGSYVTSRDQAFPSLNTSSADILPIQSDLLSLLVPTQTPEISKNTPRPSSSPGHRP
jgi:hypothetical protein